MQISILQREWLCFLQGERVIHTFSTDTGIVLRAIEMEADGIYLAKAIDGVYDSDPKLNPNAVKYDDSLYSGSN